MLPVKNAGISALMLFVVLSASSAMAQSGNISIQGRAIDPAGGVLQGATVTVTPNGGSYVTDNQGQYVIRGLAPGDYTVTVKYVGLLDFTTHVHVAEGQAQRVDATLRVAGQSEQVLVTAERPRGEAAEINRERTADNIVQVLSSEVITSLPNANIADAL